MIYGPDGKPAARPVEFERPVPRPGLSMVLSDGTRKTPLTFQQQMLAMNPEGRPFDPGVPLAPIVRGGQPIQWAPWTGYNLTFSPDKKLGVSNSVLRMFADQCAPVRVVIEQLKRELRGYKRDIVPTVEKEKDQETEDPDRSKLRDWLKKPDGYRPFSRWLNMVLEDLIVVGAPAIVRLQRVNGQPAGLRPIDAGLVTPIVTNAGLAPEPPNPAYYFAAYSMPYKEYSRDELMYLPFNERSWTPYGFGPVEQLIIYVMLALHRTLWYTNYYNASTVPPGFATVPEDWNPTQIREFKDYWDALYEGNTVQKHRVHWAPFGAKYQEIRQSPEWRYEFDEFLLRVFSWCLGVAPTPIVKQSSLGKGSEGLSEEALAAGTRPLKEFIGDEILTPYIQSDEVGQTLEGEPVPMGLGQPDYRFEFVEEREENKETQLKEDTELLDRGVLTINGVRTSRGLDPYDEGDFPMANKPMLKETAGYTPLDQIGEKPAAPPPPFGAPPGVAPAKPLAGAAAATAAAAAKGSTKGGEQIASQEGIPGPAKADSGVPPEQYHVRELVSPQEGVRVWLVDGSAIRRNVDIDFTEGTNEYAPTGGTTPTGEVWIDDATPPEEWDFIILHELHERMLMAQGMPYEQAHNAANAVELAARQAAALKVDLRKWRRKAAADLKAGRKPRGFVSDLIGKGLRHWVSKCLEDAELAKAFKRPKRSEVRTYSTSSRAKPLIAAAAAWWQHKLEAYASHYVALAIAKLGKAKKQEGDDWEPPETTEAEWSELAAQLEAMYLAGAEDSADLVGAGQMSGVEYASRRGAELIGKRWDADAGAWIDNPSQKWVISDSVREQVAAKLEQAIEDGSTVAEFRTTMVDYFSDIPYRALMIARTETGFAYNAGALANYRDQEVAEVEVMDGGTEGSCEDCDALDGETWTVEQAEADPLEHPNCTRAFAPILGTE